MTGRQSAIVSLVGAIMAAVGGFLPWASVGAIEVTGLRGDGLFAIAGGAIAALTAFYAMDRADLAARVLLTLVGVLLAILYLSKILTFADLAKPGDVFLVTTGPGLWVGLLGSVLLGLFGPSAKGSARAVSTPSVDNAAAKLAQLADLHDRGAITDTEYETKKAELLERL